MEIKALLIDMDGTILGTEEIWNSSIKYANEHFGVKVPEDFYITHIGTTLQQKYEKILPYLDGTGISPQKYCDYQIEWKWNCIKRNGVGKRSGYDNLVVYAKENNIKLALVTSSIMESVILNFRYANLDLSVFDCIVTRECVTNIKPNAEPYEKAMQNLGLMPMQCVAVEDSSIGITSAIKANAVAVFAKGTSELDIGLEDRVAYKINDFDELIEWLKNNA